MKEGRDYDVLATLPAKIDGRQTRYVGATSDGKVFGETMAEDPEAEPPIGPGAMGFTTRSNVFLLDTALGKVTDVSDGDSRHTRSGISGIDADDEWVTWLEIESIDGGGWTLYSYELSTGTERKLATDREAVRRDSTVGPEGRPTITGDSVVMSTTVFGDEHGKLSQVLSARLDGSAPLTELARGATSVDVDAEGFSYLDVTGAMRFHNTTSGETTLIDDGRSTCRIYDSGLLVTCDPSGQGTKFRVKEKDGVMTALGPFNGQVGYIDHETSWVTFVSDPDGDPTIYAIDTARKKLFKVAEAQGGWDLMGQGMALVSPFNGAKGDITLIKLR